MEPARDLPSGDRDRSKPRLLLIDAGANDAASAVIAEALAAETDRRFVAAGDPGWVDSARYDADVVLVIADPATPATTAVLEQWSSVPDRPAMLAILGEHAPESLVQLASREADDFMYAPVRRQEISQRLRRLCNAPRRTVQRVCDRLIEDLAAEKLVGLAPAFLQAIEPIYRFARVDMPVLITGETGTGKELCARAIHHLSRRRSHSFVAADCGAVPEQLFENELFGHMRGAFTDARSDHKGLVAVCEGGTLFLDEVDTLPLGTQAKLLRFLQEGTFRALGSSRTVYANVRIVAATNRNIEECVREQQVRSDLYYRLNVLRIQLPPLRDRRSDIEMLALHALENCRESTGTSATGFSQSALRVLTSHDWPGNVRELGNVVQRAALICDEDRISATHLDLTDRIVPQASGEGGSFRTGRAAAVAAFERRYIETMLEKHSGNVTHAAREARQDRRAFGRFIKKHNIDRRRFGT